MSPFNPIFYALLIINKHQEMTKANSKGLSADPAPPSSKRANIKITEPKHFTGLNTMNKGTVVHAHQHAVYSPVHCNNIYIINLKAVCAKRETIQHIYLFQEEPKVGDNGTGDAQAG